MENIEKFRLSADDSVLVIVDVQDRLAAAMKERDSVISNTLHLLEIARIKGIPVLVSEQYPKGLGPTVPELASAAGGDGTIQKITFSCMGTGEFEKRLEQSGRKKVILAGMETHVCVLMTALDMLERDFHVQVVADAVCSRTDENRLLALENLRDAGAVITNTETVLFQLLERAGTDEFRIISKRIK